MVQCVIAAMHRNLESMIVAAQLVRELGSDAVAVSRTRLVELLAADNRRAAAFWREVLAICEEELARADPARMQATGPLPPTHAMEGGPSRPAQAPRLGP